MDCIPVPCLSDNYSYLLVDEGAREAVVVDPSEAGPVRAALAERGLKLKAIWSTHHHWDHVGGNQELARATGCRVVGSEHDRERIPALTDMVRDGTELGHGGVRFSVIENPGHTLGAVSYVGAGWAFTGDTLFLAGCGRLFEGSPEQMWQSMRRLRELPDETAVWCGHEYTVKNLRFALHVEPDDEAIRARLDGAEQIRKEGGFTVPAPIEIERRTNPFLRADEPGLIEALASRHGRRVAPGVEAFSALREMKDSF